MHQIHQHIANKLLSLSLSRYSEIVIAYSGGLDSTVLLHAIAQLQKNHSISTIRAFHVHHGISEFADSWLQHCQAFSASLDVSFSYKQVKLVKKSRTSTEQQARELRYQAIKETLTGPAIVVTGQHADDQVETLLLQLKRGAGLKGLSGMPESMAFTEDALLVRPLLDISRKALEAYAQFYQLSWVEDDSNTDTNYDRNFLRHNVLPILTEHWQGFRHTVTRSMRHIAQADELLDEYVQQDYKAAVDGAALSVIKLQEYSEVRQKYVLRYWFAQHKLQMPSESILQQIIKQFVCNTSEVSSQNTKLGNDAVVSFSGIQVRGYKGYLYCLPKLLGKKDYQCNVDTYQALSTTSNSDNTCTVSIDSSTLLPAQLGHISLSLPANVNCAVKAPYLYEQKQNQPRNDECASNFYNELALHFVLNTLNVALPGRRSEIIVTFPHIYEDKELVLPKKIKIAGREHAKSLKQIYKEYNVPPWLRMYLPCVFIDNQLAAIAGVCVAEGYDAKLFDRESEYVLEITWHNKSRS
ncbi:tRNA lysidine(34) synthetase TilS [Flocculibacter collagenilyticus]|uniref:tRNA lysidine(34) synthetase TilS n=1 Tax=Flocculibacter collagenilyticus TaxID=2744479 RepID=UPI0018F55DD2|nr:tRNA lysidine(34) synthetase TilS [Flocculibacter collagenilyticus]